ncbi:MAG: NUDIX domain-containing protein [Candidatus Nanohaloarchaea archaeon]|nr:NUDIX domain-containing protein [Candidatus Nanohaloarchaea archaeon]
METLAIGRAVVVDDGRVLAIQNSEDRDAAEGRDEDQAGRWELPGGFVQDGESVEDAVRREVREETGLEVTIEAMLERVIVEHDGTRADCQYVLCGTEGRDTELAPSHQAARWVRPSAFADLDWYNYAGYSIPVLDRLAGEIDE